MISVEKALEIVLNTSKDLGTESIPFIKSVGRILKEEIYADRDFPPFDRVMMDGIAIDFEAFEKGQRTFGIEGIQAAGGAQMTLQKSDNCLEVMTGAMLPKNTNTVIRYEDVKIENGIASVFIDEIKFRQNIHTKGKDKEKGALLISENTQISAAEIGVLATVGKQFVKVAKIPKVMIVSTGNELVAVAKNPLAHQIRRSNVYTLVSLLERLKISSETAHLPDDKSVLRTTIKRFLKEYDVLLFSGAVSKGKYDYLPEVLEELGVQKKFHKVAQRPGKPFFYGKTTACTVFAFPGNPVSTFVNCLVYFYPWYYTSVGLKPKTETAILGEDVTFKPNLTCFLQVRLESKYGHLVAFPITGNGSGDLASLTNADAFIALPQEQTTFKKGATFSVIKYRDCWG